MSKEITIPIDTCAVIGMQVATEKAISGILEELISGDDTDELKIGAVRYFALELKEGTVNYD
jgi:hypothetical protein